MIGQITAGMSIQINTHIQGTVCYITLMSSVITL